MESGARPSQPATAAAPEIDLGMPPASMDEELLSCMYEECCPGTVLTRADNSPRSIKIVVMYIEPQNPRFFWAALLYGDEV